MQEIYFEESSKCKNEKNEHRKYLTLQILSYISFFLALLWLYIIVNFVVLDENYFVKLLLFLIPLIIFIVSGIILAKFKNKFALDYDYLVVSGTIMISKVINGVNRRQLYNFSTNFIEKIGKIDSAFCKTLLNNDSVKKVYLTSNQTPDEGKDFYYLLITHKGEKNLLILECSKTFMLNVYRCSKPSVKDEEFKWFI